MARDEGDVVSWVQAINLAIQGGGSAPSSTGSVSSTVSSPPQSQIGSPGHQLGTFIIISLVYDTTVCIPG